MRHGDKIKQFKQNSKSQKSFAEQPGLPVISTQKDQ